MSNWPGCLQTVRPTSPILTYGNDLSTTEINLLRSQLQSLHFHPIIVVLPKQFHVKNGDATVAEIAKTWGLGPHGMIILYSPADKNVWATCGTFNTSAGVDVAFFKRDFSQRMSMDSREGNLYAALNSSLQDVDRIIVRSQAFASHAVNQQASLRTHSHARSSQSFPVGQVFGAIIFAFLILGLLSRAIGSAGKRTRFDDPQPLGSDFNDDLERITQLTQGRAGGYVRPTNTQVPMAEFKKRAGAPIGKASAVGAGKESRTSMNMSNSSADFRNMSDESGRNSGLNEMPGGITLPKQMQAQEQLQEQEPELWTPAPEPGSEPEPSSLLMPEPSIIPEPTRSSATRSETDLIPASSMKAAEAEFLSKVFIVDQPPVSSSTGAVATSAPSSVPTFAPTSASEAAPSTPPTLPSPSILQMPSTTPILSTTPAPPIPPTASTPAATLTTPATTPVPSTPSAALSSSEAFNNSFGAAPFANLMQALETPAAAPSTLGLVPSSSSGQGDVICPGCSEPKSKDFSFCLKCGHSF